MKQKSRTPCKSILITFHGNTTHATLLTGYDHDTRTKSAWAKCNPADEYDAYTGAKLALDRLFGKEAPGNHLRPEPKKTETPENECPFKVGDLVLTRGTPFCNKCQNRPAKVIEVHPIGRHEWEVVLYVETERGGYIRQYTNPKLHPYCLVHWQDSFGKHPMDGVKATKKEEFQIGDIVEIVDPFISGGYYKKGDIGAIKRRAHGRGVYVDFAHGASSICVLPSEMKLLYRPKEG